MEANLDKLQLELDRCRRDLKMRHTQYENLETSHGQLQLRFKDVQKEAEDAAHIKQVLQDHCSHLERMAAENDRKMKQKAEYILKIEGSLHRAEQKVKDLEKENATLSKHSAQLNGNLMEKTHTVNLLTSQVGRLQESLRTLESQAATLRGREKEHQSEVDHLRSCLAQKQEEFQIVEEKQRQELITQARGYQKQLAEQLTTREKIQLELQKEADQKTKLYQDKIKDGEAQVMDIEAKYFAERKRAKTLEADVSSLQQKVSRAEQALAAITEQREGALAEAEAIAMRSQAEDLVKADIKHQHSMQLQEEKSISQGLKDRIQELEATIRRLEMDKDAVERDMAQKLSEQEKMASGTLRTAQGMLHDVESTSTEKMKARAAAENALRELLKDREAELDILKNEFADLESVAKERQNALKKEKAQAEEAKRQAIINATKAELKIQEEIEGWENQVKELQKEISGLQTRLATEKDESVEQLKSKIANGEALAMNLKDAEQRCAGLQQECEIMAARASKCEEDAQRAIEALNDAKERHALAIKNISDECDQKLVDVKTRHEEELASLNQQITNLKDEIEIMDTERKDVESEFASNSQLSQQRISELKVAVELKEEEAKKALASQNEAAKAINAEVDVLMQTLQEAETIQDANEKEIATLTQQVQQLEVQLQESNQKSQELQTQVKDALKLLKETSDAYQSLQDDHSQQTKSTTSKAGEMQLLLDELQCTLKQTEEEKSALEKDLCDLDSQLTEKTSQISKLQADMAERAQSKEKMIHTWQEKEQTLCQQLHQLVDEQETLQRRLEQAERDIQERDAKLETECQSIEFFKHANLKLEEQIQALMAQCDAHMQDIAAMRDVDTKNLSAMRLVRSRSMTPLAKRSASTLSRIPTHKAPALRSALTQPKSIPAKANLTNTPTKANPSNTPTKANPSKTPVKANPASPIDATYVDSLQRETQTLQKDVRAMQAMMGTLEDQCTQAQALCKHAQGEAAKWKAERDSVWKERSTLQEAVERLEAEGNGLKMEIHALKQQLCSVTGEGKETIDNLLHHQAVVTDLEKKLEKANGQVDFLKTKMESYRQDFQRVVTDKQRLQAVLQEIGLVENLQLDHLNDSTLSILREGRQAQMLALTEERDLLAQDLRFYKGELQRLNATASGSVVVCEETCDLMEVGDMGTHTEGAMGTHTESPAENSGEGSDDSLLKEPNAKEESDTDLGMDAVQGKPQGAHGVDDVLDRMTEGSIDQEQNQVGHEVDHEEENEDEDAKEDGWQEGGLPVHTELAENELKTRNGTQKSVEEAEDGEEAEGAEEAEVAEGTEEAKEAEETEKAEDAKEAEEGIEEAEEGLAQEGTDEDNTPENSTQKSMAMAQQEGRKRKRVDAADRTPEAKRRPLGDIQKGGLRSPLSDVSNNNDSIQAFHSPSLQKLEGDSVSEALSKDRRATGNLLTLMRQ